MSWSKDTGESKYDEMRLERERELTAGFVRSGIPYDTEHWRWLDARAAAKEKQRRNTSSSSQDEEQVGKQWLDDLSNQTDIYLEC